MVRVRSNRRNLYDLILPSPLLLLKAMRLSSTLRAVAAAALLPLAAGFSDTVPFLAFTSRQSSLLDRGLVTRSTSSPAVAPLDIARSLTSKSQELCNLDGMIIVEVQDVSVHSFT